MGSLGGLDDDFNFFLPDTLLESDSNSDDEQNADTFGESADAADLPAGFMSSALPDSPPFLEEPQPQGLLGRLGLGLQGLTGATSQPSTFEQPAYMDPRFELPERGRVDQMFGETYDPYDESEEQLPPWMSETVKPPNPTAPSFRAPAPATSAPVFQSRRTQVASGIGSQARPQGSSSPPFGLAQRGGATGGAGTRASGSRGQTEQVNPKWQQQNGMWPNSAAGGRGGGAAPAKQTQQRQTMKATRADPDSSNGGFSVVDRGHGAQTAAEIKARMQPPVAGKPILDKKAKLREAKLAAEARQHAKNLEAARLKEEAKKMEEKKRLANARIAAAREEVNEPVFNASKNAERERERERQLEREREILEAQRQADMRLKIKKEKAKSASRSRAEEDGAGGSHDEGGTAGKLRQRRAGQKDGSDSTDDTEFPDGTLRRKDRHDGKRRNQTSSQKDAERKKNGQLRSPQAAAAATRQNERTGDTMPSNAHAKPSTPTTPTRSLTSAVLPPATAVISTGMQYIMQLSWWVSGVAVNLASLLFKFIMALQMSALNGLTADHHVAFCFSFLYSFPFLVSFFTPWAPPWCVLPAGRLPLPRTNPSISWRCAFLCIFLGTGPQFAYTMPFWFNYSVFKGAQTW
eukprot:COSAG05_NODE_1673_length_4301_cov_2.823179_2_plen_633_part_00